MSDPDHPGRARHCRYQARWCSQSTLLTLRKTHDPSYNNPDSPLADDGRSRPDAERLHAGGAPGRHRRAGDPGRLFAAGDQRGAQDGQDAAVSAEINQLAQALANFKSKYGDYPPSRVLLVENGDYSSITAAQASQCREVRMRRARAISPWASSPPGRISAFRKFWPRVTLSTHGHPSGRPSRRSGTTSTATAPWIVLYILHGHECLVFFLGGMPLTTRARWVTA